MHFHLAHILPDPRLHGLNGYLEVIETIRWGLESLGHRVTTTQNAAVPDAVNIIFGFQLLTEAEMRSLPPSTIVYNLEQISFVPTDRMGNIFGYAAQNLRVWDYSRSNLAAWQKLNPAVNAQHVPIGYAPTLARIPKRPEEIDVLFYGLPSELRLTVFSKLCTSSLRAVYACGLYGPPRDDLISRSKLVLNLNLYPGRVFEVVRVSYLLANAKAVVSNVYPESEIDPDLRQAVEFVSTDQIVPTCLRLIQDTRARQALEQRGQQAIQRRDIRAIIQAALSPSPAGRGQG